MTIEEKAYDEVREKIALRFGSNVAEEIFSEIEMSGDEKVRKEIIKLVKFYYGSSLALKNTVSKDEMLAWLEKQGDKSTTLPKWKYKKDKTPLLRDSIILNKYGCVAKSPSGAIISDAWVLDYNELAKLPKEEFEKQGEQKPTDNVEPKFKVGDWVVLSTPDGEKVVQIDSIEYFKSGKLRYITSEGRWFGNGTKAHLWSIKDAKPGDMLVCKDLTLKRKN